MSVKRVGSLEIGEDLPFQEKMWKVQRVGWVVMALILLLALLGIFSTGPLSSAEVGEEGSPIRIEYPRFTRHQSTFTMDVEVAPEAVQQGQVSIWVERSFIDGYRIEHITPEPDSVSLEGNQLTYTFSASTLPDASKITFHLFSLDIGIREGDIGLQGGDSLSIRQVVYP